MLPLLTAQQIREADAYTIAHQPVSSIDLMERASKAFVSWFVNCYPDKTQIITIYCGTGNNGGDGLVIARLLSALTYKVNVKIVHYNDGGSADFKANLKRLIEASIDPVILQPGEEIPHEESPIIIDALLGSGLNKPLTGEYKKLVAYINRLQKIVVAVDVPTGFFTEGEVNSDVIAIKTDLVITFQQPKINFLLPESSTIIKCWEAVNIGLDEAFIQSLNSPYQLVEESDIKQMLNPRQRFSNKGTYGHALLIAGQDKTMGAALLAASACAYAGAGLTTACIPESGLTALNTYMPELMAIIRRENGQTEINWDQYNAIAIGPGLGKNDEALTLLKSTLTHYSKPIVVDADGLNLLAENQSLLKTLPAGSILTPHMKEFDRLFGQHTSWWQRIQTAIKKAQEHNIYILLKNDYTITATPEGKIYFNSTSDPAMATGGMGDVLTGIITSLMAQKYSPQDACIIGAYIHGKAGDELALPNKLNTVLPSQLAKQLPVTMAKLMA